MRELKKECKGCYMAREYKSYCFLYDLDIDDFDCPCFNCLIKMVCRTTCDPVDIYFNSLRDERNRKKVEANK